MRGRMVEELFIVLQHLSSSSSSGLEQQSICRLLQVSKLIRQMILLRRNITLGIKFKAEEMQQTHSFCMWISKCSQLVTSVNITVHPHEPRRSVIRQQLAAALAAARSLHIKTFKINSAAEEILQLLPSSSLTSLVLSGPPWLGLQSSKLIGQLTNLQSLVLLPQRPMPLLPLQQLQHLSYVEIQCVQDHDQVLELPARLKTLKISFCLDPQHDDLISNILSVVLTTGTLQLTHLTALTHLEVPQMTVTANSILPIGLMKLKVKRCLVLPPLSQLLQLQHLTADMSDLAADELGQLRKLPQLQGLRLSYRNVHLGRVAIAAAWPSLTLPGPSAPGSGLVVAGPSGFSPSLSFSGLAGSPGPGPDNQPVQLRVIRSLELTCCTVCKDTVTALASLNQLTRLASSACYFQVTVREVAGLIKQLSTLQVLSLLQPSWSDAVVSAVSAVTDSGSLVLAAGTLKQLSNLSFSGIALGSLSSTTWVTIAGLTAATGLRSLSLRGCQLTDLIVDSIAWSLTKLTNLDIQSNAAISSAVSPAVGEHLRDLRALYIDGRVVWGDGAAAGQLLQQQLPQLEISARMNFQ